MPIKQPQYIDTHAHLFYSDYKSDLDDVLKRAQDAGIIAIIIPGTDANTSREAVQLADKYPQVFACVGIHPHDASKEDRNSLKVIEELSPHPKVVAIGEIGLDYYYDYSPRDIQKDIFYQQLVLAVNRDKPVVIHTRDSSIDAYAIVRNVISEFPDWKNASSTPTRGVFHCFPGNAEEASMLYGLGFYVSYPGILTFKKSNSLEMLRQIGVENILLETDSPYMTPVPFRGKRNEPGFLPLISKNISETLHISEEEIATITTHNARRLFRIP